MALWVLAIFPLMWAGAYLAFDSVLFGGTSYSAFLRTEIELAKALSLVGAWAAAFSFARGEYLRRAWFLLGGCSALLLVSDALRLFAYLGYWTVDTRNAVQAPLIGLANVAQIVGIWMLAQTWRVADLSLPGTRRSQWSVLAATVLLSAVVAGPGLVSSLRQIGGGQGAASALISILSSLGDAISLCLIAPLLLTALALRGGLFAWPWALLTLSNLGWLLFDGVQTLGPILGLSVDGTNTVGETFRALACALGFSAGMIQRSIVFQVSRLGTSAPP